MTIKVWPSPPTSDSNESFSIKRWFEQLWNYFKGAIYITPENAVGIKTDNPDTRFALTVNGASLTTGTSNAVSWTDRTDSVIWQAYATGGNMALWNGTIGDAIRIADSTGVITLPYGQLSFPATQIASSGANVLDDYEEGTWTPGISGGTLAGSYTYSLQEGTYVKIGKCVFITGRLTVSGGTPGTGTLLITGLPFATASSGPVAGSINIGYAAGFGTAPIRAAILPPSATTIRLYKWSSTTTWNVTPSVVGDVSVGSDIIFGGFYLASD